MHPTLYMSTPLAWAAAVAVGAAAACGCTNAATPAAADPALASSEASEHSGAAFNCSPAPRVDPGGAPSGPMVWVAERPGRDAVADTPSARPTPSEADLDRWVEHMRRRGVDRVLCLLGEKHLKLYGTQLEGGTLRQAVERRGLRWAGVPFSRERPLYFHLIAAARQLRDAERSGESVVVHCSAGCGRSAAVVVAWLCGRGGEEFDAAVARLAVEAAAEGVQRQPLEVGERDLREACEELSMQWCALGLGATGVSAAESGAASPREAQLERQLQQADKAVLQVSKELRQVKRQAAAAEPPGSPPPPGEDHEVLTLQQQAECEICGGFYAAPVTYHMREHHPGCGGPSGGRGFNADGSYVHGIGGQGEGECGEGGVGLLAWYSLCEGCKDAHAEGNC